MIRVLVTGCAGFIGFHLCENLLKNKNIKVYGIDNLNSYYDVRLKRLRLKKLKKHKYSQRFQFIKGDIANKNFLSKEFKLNKFEFVINLAAQAGVRHSVDFPETYLESNVIGFFNILESCRKFKIKHLIFASTSSVYGDTKKYPNFEEDNTDKPQSFYAATKKSNEIMAYSYSNIYKLPITGLRFFTVYGPYGRPDMSLFKFSKLILQSKAIPLYNNGNHIRDFTYVSDVTETIVRLIKKPPRKKTPFDLFNVASSNPIHLKKFLKIIENILGKKAKIKNEPFQLGDVHKTFGSIKKLIKKIKYKPQTSLKKGIESFIDWYLKSFK